MNRLREECKETAAVIALGTNAARTTAMIKSRAHRGAPDENAIIWNSERADMIIEPLSITLLNALSGEVTVQVAAAIVSSEAKRILLPMNQEGIDVVRAVKESLPI